jgi:hypothetical protein
VPTPVAIPAQVGGFFEVCRTKRGDEREKSDPSRRPTTTSKTSAHDPDRWGLHRDRNEATPHEVTLLFFRGSSFDPPRGCRAPALNVTMRVLARRSTNMGPRSGHEIRWVTFGSREADRRFVEHFRQAPHQGFLSRGRRDSNPRPSPWQVQARLLRGLGIPIDIRSDMLNLLPGSAMR